MPPSLQAALVPLIVMGLTALAVKLKIDAKVFSDNILAIATTIAALIVAAVGAILTRLDKKKIARAENIVPGITTPNGPAAPVTIITNDPTTPAPPVVIQDNTLPPPTQGP